MHLLTSTNIRRQSMFPFFSSFEGITDLKRVSISRNLTLSNIVIYAG